MAQTGVSSPKMQSLIKEAKGSDSETCPVPVRTRRPGASGPSSPSLAFEVCLASR